MVIGKAAIIGGGAMAEALIKGMRQAGKLADASWLTVSDPSPTRREALAKLYGVHTTADNKAAVAEANWILLAVKPQVAAGVLEELATVMAPSTVAASIMAGWSVAQLQQLLPNRPVIRIMPNTPLSVGAGMSAIVMTDDVPKEIGEEIEAAFAASGETVRVPESWMDAITGLSGSGPGFLFAILDAMSDAGVAAGLPRNIAVQLAAQTMMGAGKMAVESGLHPAVLRDQVTSPGGTTIAGVLAMEAAGVRTAMHAAVAAAAERSRQLR